MSADNPLARFRLRRCPYCGYDLRGHEDGSPCPECAFGPTDQLILQRKPSWLWPCAGLGIGSLFVLGAAAFMLAGFPEFVAPAALAALGIGIGSAGYIHRPRNGINVARGYALIGSEGIVLLPIGRPDLYRRLRVGKPCREILGIDFAECRALRLRREDGTLNESDKPGFTAVWWLDITVAADAPIWKHLHPHARVRELKNGDQLLSASFEAEKKDVDALRAELDRRRAARIAKVEDAEKAV